MSMADDTILIFWFVCLIRGIFKGPINEIFSIAGVLGGLIVGSFSFSIFSKVLPGWMGSNQLTNLICFLVLFVFSYLLMTVFGIIATYLLHLRRSGWGNRIFGAGFGILKGVLFIAVLLVPLVAFLPKTPTWIGGSVLLSYENYLSEKMAQAIPSAIHDQFTSHIDAYKKSWFRNEELSNIR